MNLNFTLQRMNKSLRKIKRDEMVTNEVACGKPWWVPIYLINPSETVFLIALHLDF